ncbi:MAG: hypothetical protein AAB770_01945 [Patescibacteria group bacterium]
MKIRSKTKITKSIYYNLKENKKSTTLVLFLSGLSGEKDTPLFKTAEKEFCKMGFSILRTNLCNSNEKKTKKTDALALEIMNFSIYAIELKNLLDYTGGERYSKFIFVGHSFGAPILITFLNKYKKYAQRTSLVLWDPSILPFKKKLMDEAFAFDRERKVYIEKRGKDACIFNAGFYKELSETMDAVEILKGLSMKVCVIGADKGVGKDAKKYFAKLNLRNKRESVFTIIKKANHLFDGRRTQKELFEKTLKFLKK